MSGKHVAKDQPATFEFNAANLKRIQEILKKYPTERKKSAVMPLLDLARKDSMIIGFQMQRLKK